MKGFANKLVALAAYSLLLTASGHTYAQQKIVEPAPRAVLPLTLYSFGDVYKGEVISYIFVIRNAGDAALEIKDFTSG